MWIIVLDLIETAELVQFRRSKFFERICLMFLLLKERQEANRQRKNGQRVTDHQDTHSPFDQRREIGAYRKFIGRAW